jgi:hypothetical protein
MEAQVVREMLVEDIMQLADLMVYELAVAVAVLMMQTAAAQVVQVQYGMMVAAIQAVAAADLITVWVAQAAQAAAVQVLQVILVALVLPTLAVAAAVVDLTIELMAMLEVVV